MVPAELQPGDTVELTACLEGLRNARLRVTAPRTAVLRELLRDRTPRAFQEIHEQLKEVCDPVTVYRVLIMLENIGLVRRLFRNGGTALFKIEYGAERFYVATKNEAKIEEIEGASSPEIRLAIHRLEERLRALGWREVTHVVQFFHG